MEACSMMVIQLISNYMYFKKLEVVLDKNRLVILSSTCKLLFLSQS
jgi:hypothetical protein